METNNPMQSAELMIVVTALSTARLCLSEFRLPAQDNDEREIPHNQIYEVMSSPYAESETEKALHKFQEACKDIITLNQIYIEKLTEYRDMVNEQQLNIAIDLAIQFHKNQINGINFSLDTQRPYYEVMLEYYPELTADLENSMGILQKEAVRICQTQLAESRQ